MLWTDIFTAIKYIILAKEDYTSITEIVTFLPGETRGNVSLQIHDDMRIEGNETVQIYLIAGAGVNLTPLPRTEVTIIDGEFEILSLPVPLPLRNYLNDDGST